MAAAVAAFAACVVAADADTVAAAACKLLPSTEAHLFSGVSHSPYLSAR
jgi:hypothetical protein